MTLNHFLLMVVLALTCPCLWQSLRSCSPTCHVCACMCRVVLFVLSWLGRTIICSALSLPMSLACLTSSALFLYLFLNLRFTTLHLGRDHTLTVMLINMHRPWVNKINKCKKYHHCRHAIMVLDAKPLQSVVNTHPACISCDALENSRKHWK